MTVKSCSRLYWSWSSRFSFVIRISTNSPPKRRSISLTRSLVRRTSPSKSLGKLVNGQSAKGLTRNVEANSESYAYGLLFLGPERPLRIKIRNNLYLAKRTRGWRWFVESEISALDWRPWWSLLGSACLGTEIKPSAYIARPRPAWIGSLPHIASDHYHRPWIGFGQNAQNRDLTPYARNIPKLLRLKRF